jgi:hypothetical protein
MEQSLTGSQPFQNKVLLGIKLGRTMPHTGNLPTEEIFMGIRTHFKIRVSQEMKPCSTMIHSE